MLTSLLNTEVCFGWYKLYRYHVTEGVGAKGLRKMLSYFTKNEEIFLDQRVQAWETSHSGIALNKFCWEGQGTSPGFLIIKMFSSQMFLN